jgi:hypothetical protein
MEYVLHSGKKSFIPAGTQPRHGDQPMVLAFDRTGTVPWREDLWFCADLRVDQYSDVRIAVVFITADQRELKIQYEQIPNLNVSFRVRLDEIWSKRFFLPVFPGSYKIHCVGLPTDPQDVVRIEIRVTPGKDFCNAVLTKAYISDTPPGRVHPDAPIVDELGQLNGYEWPTKTHSFQEMAARLTAEYERAKQPQPPLPGRSRFGGFAGKHFAATGWFRTEHDGQRWWLVDPDGYAFFSHGVCYGARMGEFGWFTGMEDFYLNAPSPDDPQYRAAFTQPRFIAEYVKRHGTTERSEEWMFNPARANMIRVFGDNWWEAWRAIAVRRFRDWGINTTGVGIVNFIDERLEDFLRLSKLPYAVTLKRFPVTERFIFRDFPDVFDPEYAVNSRAFAENELARYGQDPYLLGYFLHNEPEWMFQADCCLAWELLVKDEPLRSRRHLVEWLQQRYADVDALNAAWGTVLPSFDRLLDPLPRSTVLSAQGQSDLLAYEQLLIDAFGRIPLEACRKVAPHHLCLGLRYSHMNDKIRQSCQVFDVFSFNCYNKHPENSLAAARVAGKPTLIGEWHFGGPDNGLLRTALLSAASQEERGKAYKRYLQTAAADPNCVGAHYFEYNNQTLMGRFDGEHMAHGLIDCTNLPYPHMVEAIKTCSEQLYDVLSGAVPPYDEPIEYLSPEW